MNQAGFIPSSSFIDIVLLRFLCCKKHGSSSRSILTLYAVYSALLGGSCNQKIRPHKTAEMASHVTGDVGGSKATEELTASWPPWNPQNHRRSFFPTKLEASQNYISLNVLWSSIFVYSHLYIQKIMPAIRPPGSRRFSSKPMFFFVGSNRRTNSDDLENRTFFATNPVLITTR